MIPFLIRVSVFDDGVASLDKLCVVAPQVHLGHGDCLRECEASPQGEVV